MIKIKVSRFDVVDYLKTERDMEEFMQAAMADGTPELLQKAIGAVARARGMAEIARKAKVSRESLYKSLSPNGKPAFATIAKVVEALGGKLTIEWKSAK